MNKEAQFALLGVTLTLPEFTVGDEVGVHQKIKEEGKERTQVFEGLVIARKHGKEPGGTFTVRKVSGGIGVERVFPLYSPNIVKITIKRRFNTKRAKLYYMRTAKGKRARLKEVKKETRKKTA